MIEEVTFYSEDLTHGICKCCGEESDEIDINTDICIDCFEAQRFYEISMKNFKEKII